MANFEIDLNQKSFPQIKILYFFTYQNRIIILFQNEEVYFLLKSFFLWVNHFFKYLQFFTKEYFQIK